VSALRKSTEVDSLSLVRAVRHARTTGPDTPPSAPPPEKPPDPTPPPESKERAARIGRTALPPKNEIFCYECGYSFQATGRVHALLCPKCKKTLDQADYTIDAECAESVRTTGNIRLAAGGVLKSGALIARDIVLAGRIEGGTVKATRRIEIEPAAVYDPDLLAAQDLTVAAGAECRFKGKRLFRHIDVRGVLDGHFAASGGVTVHAGGHLKGRLQGPHLVVEEGGGLTAELEITPPGTK